MTDDERSLEAQLFNKARDGARLSTDRSRGLPRACRIAAARPIQNDNAVLALEFVEQRMGEHAGLPGEPVNQQQCWARAFVEIVDARAVDFDEVSMGRQSLFDLPRGPCRKQREAGQRQDHKDDDDDGGDPGDGHHRRISWPVRPRARRYA